MVHGTERSSTWVIRSYVNNSWIIYVVRHNPMGRWFPNNCRVSTNGGNIHQNILSPSLDNVWRKRKRPSIKTLPFTDTVGLGFSKVKLVRDFSEKRVVSTRNHRFDLNTGSQTRDSRKGTIKWPDTRTASKGTVLTIWLEQKVECFHRHRTYFPSDDLLKVYLVPDFLSVTEQRKRSTEQITSSESRITQSTVSHPWLIYQLVY